MGKIRQFRQSFAAGHIDKTFLSRSDSQEFDSACEELENFELRLSGGIERRAGSTVLATADVGQRSIPWEFDDGNRYVVDLSSDGFARIRPVLGTPGPTAPAVVWAVPIAELADPAVLRELDYVQQLNTMIITHQSIRPFRIVRDEIGVLSFQKEQLPYRTLASGAEMRPIHKFPNFLNQNIWMTPGALTGATTMKMEAYDILLGGFYNYLDYWQLSHKGQFFRYENVWFRVDGFANEAPFDPQHTANITIFGSITDNMVLRLFPATDVFRFDVGDILTGVTTGATVEVLDTTQGVAEIPFTDLTYTDGYGGFTQGDGTSPGNVQWPGLIVRQLAGTLQAPSLALSGEAPAADTEDIGNGVITSRTQMLSDATETGRSLNWAEQAFSATRGYPAAVGLHAGRLWFGGTPELPNFIWASKAQDFFNFDYGQGFPDDAISAPITGEQQQTVRNLVSGPVLEVFTDQAEYYVPGYETRPITPESFTLIPTSRHGILRSCKPVRMAYATFFVDRSGSAMYRQYYDDEIRSIKAELVSGAATTLINNPLQLARQRGRKAEGQEVLWGVNEDGTAFQFRWWPVTGASAFSRMTRSGGYGWNSFCYVDGTRFAVATPPGMAPILEQESLLCWQDGAEVLTAGAAQSVWALPARFPVGSQVDVTTREEPDGVMTDRSIIDLGRFTVGVGGLIDLGAIGRTEITVGTTAVARCRPTPINFVPMSGDTRGMVKKVVSYSFPLLDTYFVRINARSLRARQPVAGLFPAPLDNEDIRVWQLGYGVRQAPEIMSDRPLPAIVLGFAAEVEI